MAAATPTLLRCGVDLVVNADGDLADPPAAIDVRFPRRRAAPLASVLQLVAEAPRLEPYSAEAIDFCAAFARELARRSRRVPELQALSFWMRKAELHRLQAEFRSLGGANLLLVPRGVVFHIPPANVDTMFVYSWLLSVLAGNSNIVRLTGRETEHTELILGVLTDLAARHEHKTMARNTLMLRYGHDDEATAALSLVADMRVIWGGDVTVNQLRRFRLAPQAIDLTFPDRSSLAVINSDHYDALDDLEREDLAARFFNDAYSFDQLGCSSPRLVVWVGSVSRTEHASKGFFDHLRGVVSRTEYRVETATAIDKFTFSCRAVLDHPVSEVKWLGNEVTVLPLERLPVVGGGEFCGAGSFFQFRCERLADLANYLGRRDQTLTHEGFSEDQLRELATVLNGRGIDRMVPVGEALAFNRWWDGNDLLQAFSRHVIVTTRVRDTGRDVLSVERG